MYNTKKKKKKKFNKRKDVNLDKRATSSSSTIEST